MTRGWPDIIRAAASSPLGIVALVALLLGAIALAFFRKEDVKLRAGTFVLLLLGGGLLIAAVLREPRHDPNSETPSEQGESGKQIPSDHHEVTEADASQIAGDLYSALNRKDADGVARLAGAPFFYLTKLFASTADLKAEVQASADVEKDINPKGVGRHSSAGDIVSVRTVTVAKMVKEWREAHRTEVFKDFTLGRVIDVLGLRDGDFSVVITERYPGNPPIELPAGFLVRNDAGPKVVGIYIAPQSPQNPP